MLHVSLSEAFRQLKNNKLNSAVNIIGIAFALTIIALIGLYEIYELKVGVDVPHADRLYRVLSHPATTKDVEGGTPLPLCAMLNEKIPNVVHATSIYDANVDVVMERNKYNSIPMFAVDSLVDIALDIHLLNGKIPENIASNRDNVLVCQSLAFKLFGSKDPVGQQIEIVGKNYVVKPTISGVYKDFTKNNLLQPEILAGQAIAYDIFKSTLIVLGQEETSEDLMRAYFSSGNMFSTFVLLNKNASSDDVAKELNKIVRDRTHEGGFDEGQLYSLQPSSEIYLHSDSINNNPFIQGNVKLLYILGCLAVLVLLAALVNYVNLSTADALMRLRIVAIKRILGASKKEQYAQNILNAMVMVFVAFVLSLMFSYLTLPFMSQFVERKLTLFELGFDVLWVLFGVMMICVVISAIVGVVVSMRMNRSSLVSMVNCKKTMRVNSRKGVTNIFVIFQFLIFIVIVTTVFAMQGQLDFVVNADIGVKKEGLLNIPLQDKNAVVLKNELAGSMDVLSVSNTSFSVPTMSVFTINYTDSIRETLSLYAYRAGERICKTLDLTLVSGQDFDENSPKGGLILTASAAKLMQVDMANVQCPLGYVVGICKDLNIQSLHMNNNPGVFIYEPNSNKYLLVSVRSNNMRKTLQDIQKAWDKVPGKGLLTCEFVDDVMLKIYASDQKLIRLLSVLAIIAIVIASLGLFALSCLLCRQREKEIGIRKVNGAQVLQILLMLSKQYLLWVVVAWGCAVPISYYIIGQWLQNFASKVPVQCWIFVASGLLTTLITECVVLYWCYKAATRNPITILKNE